MYNSESNQPNEWNVNPFDLADSPAKYGNALKAWTKRESDWQSVKLTGTDPAPTSEDETAKLAFSNQQTAR